MAASTSRSTPTPGGCSGSSRCPRRRCRARRGSPPRSPGGPAADASRSDHGYLHRDMLDHLSIQCVDVAASAAFYDAVLRPLGGERIMAYGDDVIGFGVPPMPDFWLGPR